MEIDFLSGNELLVETIPFYVYLDELKKVYTEFKKRNTYYKNEANAKDRLLLSLRINILSFVCADACKTIFNYFEKELDQDIDGEKTKGLRSLKTINTISKTLIERINRELYFSDPDFFIQDIFSNISHAMSSVSYSKIMENFDNLLELIVSLETTGLFYTFFDFSGELRRRLIVHNDELSTNDRQIVFFENGPLWIDNDLNGSVYSLIFCTNSQIEKTVKFIEIIRIYYLQKTLNLESSRSLLLSQIAKRVIETKGELADLTAVSSGVIAGYSNDEIKMFLARAYNNHIINKYKNEIEKIVEKELERHKGKAYAIDSEQTVETHKIIFASIIEKIAALFTQNQKSALIPYSLKSYREEVLVLTLSEIIKSTYIHIMTRVEKL
jgi:hypothetical protein